VSKCKEHFNNLKNFFHCKEHFIQWNSSKDIKVLHGIRCYIMGGKVLIRKDLFPGAHEEEKTSHSINK